MHNYYILSQELYTTEFYSYSNVPSDFLQVLQTENYNRMKNGGHGGWVEKLDRGCRVT